MWYRHGHQPFWHNDDEVPNIEGNESLDLVPQSRVQHIPPRIASKCCVRECVQSAILSGGKNNTNVPGYKCNHSPYRPIHPASTFQLWPVLLPLRQRTFCCQTPFSGWKRVQQHSLSSWDEPKRHSPIPKGQRRREGRQGRTSWFGAPAVLCFRTVTNCIQHNTR
jgi:hypothetical protein